MIVIMLGTMIIVLSVEMSVGSTETSLPRRSTTAIDAHSPFLPFLPALFFQGH